MEKKLMFMCYPEKMNLVTHNVCSSRRSGASMEEVMFAGGRLVKTKEVAYVRKELLKIHK